MSTLENPEQLAKDSGIPRIIIEMIQDALDPEMFVCQPKKSELSSLPIPKYCSSQAGFLSEEEKINYSKILENHPELQSIIEGEQQFYMSRNERMSSSVIGRHKLAEETNRNSRFKGLAFQFLLHEPETSNDDDRFAQLVCELDKMGFAISNVQSYVEGYRFKTRSEAEAFLKENGSTASGTSIIEETTRTFEFEAGETPFGSIMKQIQLMADTQIISGHTVPGFISHLKIGVYQRIPAGSKVSKISDNQFRVDAPACYTARLYKRLAYVSKVRDKFEMVRSMRTSAPNYRITNAMVIEQLKSWDKKYGIKILSAGGDQMEIEFKKLPADMSSLCTESFLFCGELELTDDENMNAALMRHMADEIRKTKKINFWWD